MSCTGWAAVLAAHVTMPVHPLSYGVRVRFMRPLLRGSFSRHFVLLFVQCTLGLADKSSHLSVPCFDGATCMCGVAFVASSIFLARCQLRAIMF